MKRWDVIEGIIKNRGASKRVERAAGGYEFSVVIGVNFVDISETRVVVADVVVHFV